LATRHGTRVLPHLFYFPRLRPLGPLYFFAVAHASPDELRVTGGVPQVAPFKPLQDLLIHHLAETARFATTMADDAKGILARLAQASGQDEMLQAIAYALVEAELT